MAYSLNVDLRLKRNEDHEKAFRVFSDDRVKRWRGAYKENYLYKKHDGVQKDGEAWVAILQSSNAEPGGPGSATFWSPLQVLNLNGYTALTVANPEGNWPGFSTAALLEATTGRITVRVTAALFAAAPDSTHYAVQLTSPLGVVTYPIKGTMLFGTP